MNKAKAVFMTIIIQAIAAGIFFLGMLLDPLMGLGAAFLYFIVVGTYFIYKYLRNNGFSEQKNTSLDVTSAFIE